jgi:GPH family glycoside/pentoside/hexuronide:cation symporter
MYLLITGILFFTAYTVYKIPYDALGIELTPDYKERTALMAVRKVFHSGGEMLIQTMWLLATWWATVLHKPGDMRIGMLVTGILFAVFCAAMIVTAFVGTRERKATEVAAQMGFAESVKCTLQNRLFVRLVLSIFAIALAIMTLAAYVNYLFIYYLESPKLLAANGMYAGVMGIPFALLWWRIANRIGKPQAMLLSEGVMVLGSLATLLVFNRSFPYLVFVYGTIYAFGWAGVLVTGATIMADITDVDELETGQRREGSYGGVFGFIFKLGVAGSAPLMGYGIDLVGFVPELGANQSPETFLKLRLITALVSAFFAAVGMTFVWRFPLTPERALEVRRILEERRGKRGAIV